MKAIPYNIYAPLKMRMPLEGSALQGGVAAAHKVSCAPQRLRGWGDEGEDAFWVKGEEQPYASGRKKVCVEVEMSLL